MLCTTIFERAASIQRQKEEIKQAQVSVKNDNYAQIITPRHLDRLIRMIDPAKPFGRILPRGFYPD